MRCGIQLGLLNLSVWRDAQVLSDYIVTFAHAEMFSVAKGHKVDAVPFARVVERHVLLCWDRGRGGQTFGAARPSLIRYNARRICLAREPAHVRLPDPDHRCPGFSDS